MSQEKHRTVAIIPAAGFGVRMGGNRPKQFLEINGMPILGFTLKTFQECEAVDRMIVVVPEKEVEICRRDVVEPYGLEKVMGVIAGGKRRQESVRLGIEAAGKGFDLVVIHDGVRPLVDGPLIRGVVSAAGIHGAAVAGLPARETVKKADESGVVVRTLDRSGIWLIQTPQAFSSAVIREAHERARREGWPEATDDAALVERLGVPVKIVRGSERNIKVTTPSDLELVRFFLEGERRPRAERRETRTGI